MFAVRRPGCAIESDEIKFQEKKWRGTEDRGPRVRLESLASVSFPLCLSLSPSLSFSRIFLSSRTSITLFVETNQ